jgi:hypothetical protein
VAPHPRIDAILMKLLPASFVLFISTQAPRQCDLTFCEKKGAQFCPNIAPNGALLNKNIRGQSLII